MLKKNLSALLCAVIGLFAFIVSAFNYMEEATAYDFFEEEFKMFKEADINCAGIIPVFQVLILVVGGLMLVWGALALLKGIGKLEQLPDDIAGVKIGVISKIMLVTMAVLNVLQFIFVIIFLADVNDLLDTSFGIGFGVIFAVILSVGAFVADYVLGKKFAVVEETAEESADAE